MAFLQTVWIPNHNRYSFFQALQNSIFRIFFGGHAGAFSPTDACFKIKRH